MKVSTTASLVAVLPLAVVATANRADTGKIPSQERPEKSTEEITRRLEEVNSYEYNLIEYGGDGSYNYDYVESSGGCSAGYTDVTCYGGTVMISTSCDDATCSSCGLTMDYTALTGGQYTCDETYFYVNSQQANVLAAGVASYYDTIVETGVTMSYSSSVCAEYCSPYCALCDGATVTANCTYTCVEAYCDQCIDAIVASLTDTQSTQVYYGTLAGMFAAYPMNATCLTNPTTAQCTATLDAYFEQYVLSEGGFDGKTPYTFQTNSDVFGMPRPSATGSDESAVLAAASGTCYNWDGGQALPATNPILTYSSPPNGLQPEDFSPTQPLEFVSAFQHLYQILRPEMLVERVTNAYRPSGSISALTTKQARDVIYKFKEAFEKNMAKDWDKESSGKMYHTAFADDSGAIGTFGRMLSDVTLESVPLSIVCCASLHSRLAAPRFFLIINTGLLQPLISVWTQTLCCLLRDRCGHDRALGPLHVLVRSRPQPGCARNVRHSARDPVLHRRDWAYSARWDSYQHRAYVDGT